MSTNQTRVAYRVPEPAATPLMNMPAIAARDMRIARIMIVDEQPISRAGLRALLQSAPGFNVVGEASRGEMVVRLARDLRPDVVLIDCSVSLHQGMHLLRQLQAGDVSVRVLLLSSVVEHKDILKALQLGAAGILMKDSPAAMLFKGIRTVVEGQYWIGRDGVTGLVHALREGNARSQNAAAAGEFGLTPREIQILETVVRGYSNMDIAERFKLSLNTVKHHISHVFDKLGVSNRLELALFAINHRLVDQTGEAMPSDLKPNKPAAGHSAPRSSGIRSIRG